MSTTTKREDVLEGVEGYPEGPWDTVDETFVFKLNEEGTNAFNFSVYATSDRVARAVADLTRRAPAFVYEIRELREAIRRVDERRARPDETLNDHFDRLAAMFQAETGRMVPGKDQPMDMAPRDREADMAAWRKWNAEPYDALVAMLPDNTATEEVSEDG